MPETRAYALLEEGRRTIEESQAGPRGWHDRKWPDGEVPEKIRKIAGWKRAMKDFMNQDAKLNDLVALFTQKFVQLGQSRNFTLSTLMDMAWTVLILTWEAVVNEKLPMMEEVERGFKEKYEDLMKAMMEVRRQYLAEVTELRDRIRSSTLSSSMQAALAEITAGDEGDGGDHGIYRFQPEIALDPKTQEYFKAAMQENMKIALTKGAAAAGETIQLLMSQLTDAQSELEKLREQLEDALLQAKLSEGIEKRPPPPRKVSVVDASSQEQVKKLQAELDALRAESDAAKQDSERQKAILQVFGLEASATLDDARKLWESLNSPGDDWAGEVEKLREKNKALVKQSKTLEEELAEFKKKNHEETCRKLQSQVSDLQAEIEKLKQQLATKNLPSKGDGAEENEALKRQLAMLKKQVEAAGKGDAVKDLMKQNEALEAELAALKKQLTEKVAEVQETTKVADAARRQSTDLMGQVELMKKELERAKKDLDSERRRSAALEAAVEAFEEGANGDGQGLAEANNRVRKLEQTLKGAREENDSLKKENGVLKEQLEEAKIMRKALEQAMEELRRKFEDFKRRLQEKGVDVSILDEALAEAGMPLHPMSVFDRLYKDAIRRQNRSQEKWVVDMRNAQQETWERILGIYDGPPLTKEQVNALVENGLIDIRMFGMEPKETKEAPRMFCPRCGSTMRASTPDDASAQPRPHTHGASLSERSKPKLERVRTWAGSVTSLRTAGAVAVPQGALTYTNAEAFTRKDLYLDIVGFHPASPLQERRPFAIVSEADQYRKHCRLQRFTEPNALDPERDFLYRTHSGVNGWRMCECCWAWYSYLACSDVASNAANPGCSVTRFLVRCSLGKYFPAGTQAKLEPPPTATLDSASAMTLDLRETQAIGQANDILLQLSHKNPRSPNAEVKSPPPMLSEPAAPPLQQRRQVPFLLLSRLCLQGISARDAKIVEGKGPSRGFGDVSEVQYLQESQPINHLLSSYAVGICVCLFCLLLGEAATARHYAKVHGNLMTALQKRKTTAFRFGLWKVGKVILTISPIVALREYVAGLLELAWRESLTRRLVSRYLSDGTASKRQSFYSLTLTGEIDNPDQRICQDVGSFVNTAVSLSQDVVRTVLSVLAFAPTLYAISPAACFGGMAYAILGTLLATRGFGAWLGLYQMRCVQQEAGLRYKLIRVRENAESIAFFEGGEAELSKFNAAFTTLLDTAYQRVLVAAGYGMLNRNFQWATFVVTPVLVGPAYLKGKVEFGVIAQTSMAFNTILNAMTLVMHRLEALSDVSVRVQRLHRLDLALRDCQAERAACRRPGVREQQCIHSDTVEDGPVRVCFQDVTLKTPLRADAVPRVLCSRLSFELLDGQSLLVTGESGIGKSSLLRAAAGLWTNGSGTIQLCNRSHVFFMPQKPYMFLGSLRSQLLYPRIDDRMLSDGELAEALKRVRLGDLLDRHNLNETKDWTSILSLGQQQRINFARLLLMPQSELALMDECTSACDVQSESLLYQHLQKQLRSYVSVGHRPALRKFHSHVLWLRHVEGDRQARAEGLFLPMSEFESRVAS
ncbi:ABCC2 [Symbiodinium sp. CCMP2456]|nr:ABCC2 [Symbiodinium sp. CCMP2456]